MWCRARCPLAAPGPSQRRCGLPRAQSTKESANASVGPRATALSPRLTAALTSSCISLTWRGSTSPWKATRSPTRCAPSRRRTRSCRPWRWSSPTWRRAPNTRPGPATSSVPRSERRHPGPPGSGETPGAGGGRTRRERTTVPLEMGHPKRGGSVVPVKSLLEEGVGDGARHRGALGHQHSLRPPQPTSHHLKNIKALKKERRSLVAEWRV